MAGRNEPIRALVIDDSAFSRQTITRMLSTSPLVDVVGTAFDGDDALRKAFDLQPDVITLDLQMPRMDGFTFLRLLMANRPTPVIVVSSRAGDEDVFKALDLGAVDFVAKPTSRASEELVEIQDELIRKVHAVRSLRIEKVGDGPSSGRAPAFDAMSGPDEVHWPAVVAIGSSTGGPAGLMRILESFDEAPPFGVLIAQHMPAGFTSGFAERIDRKTVFRAREARDGDAVLPGTVLVAPGGTNLCVASRGSGIRVSLDEDEVPTYCRPSVDRLFESVAKTFGSRAVGVVLTGMGDDGSRGVVELENAGALVIAESEESAVVFGMPKQAILSGSVNRVLPLWEIPDALRSGLGSRTPEVGDE